MIDFELYTIVEINEIDCQSRDSVDDDLEMDGADAIQVVPVDVLGIGATHDVDEHVGGDVAKVGEDERRAVAVLVAIGKVVEGYEADGRLALAVGRERVVGDRPGEVQVGLELARAQHEHVARIGAHDRLVGHELLGQPVVGPIGLRLPAVDLVELEEHARLRLVVLVVARANAHVLGAEHLDDLKAAHLVHGELVLEIGRIHARVAVDDLLAALVHNQIGAEELVEQVHVVHVRERILLVLVARLDAYERGVRVALRPEAEARVDANVQIVDLLVPHDAEVVVVGRLALVNDGHEHGHHGAEEARYEHVEAGVEEADARPTEAVAAAYLALVRIPHEEEEVVELVGERETIFDDQLFFVRRRLLRVSHCLLVDTAF